VWGRKQNGVNPYSYLRIVIDTVPRIIDPDAWKTLLPWNTAEETDPDLGAGKN